MTEVGTGKLCAGTTLRASPTTFPVQQQRFARARGLPTPRTARLSDLEQIRARLASLFRRRDVTPVK